MSDISVADISVMDILSFIGTGTGAFVVGFAFLARPPGLFRKLTALSVPNQEA